LREFNLEDKHTLKLEMLSYLRQNPKRASVEVNSLFSYIEEGAGMSRIKELVEEIHLIVSDTESGRMVADVLKEYLESLNVSTYIVPGFGS